MWLQWSVAFPRKYSVRAALIRASRRTILRWGKWWVSHSVQVENRWIAVHELMKHVQLKSLRLRVYSTLTAILIAIGSAVMAFGGVDKAHPVMLGLLTGLAAIFVLLVVFDSVYHAITKTDALCIHCGESRKMRSFCVARECPHCGK